MTDLLNILSNIVNAGGTIQLAIKWVCFIMGFTLTWVALKQAQRRQELGTNAGSWGSPIASFLTAAVFMSFPAVVEILNTTLLGTAQVSSQKIFAYGSNTVGQLGGAEGKKMIRSMVYVIQIVGVIAIGRGFYLLNQSAQGGQGPKTFGPGLTFVISGTLASNFPVFYGIMESILT